VNINLKSIFVLLLISASWTSQAQETYTGLWTGFDVVGDLYAKREWKYYFDSQLELLDTKYKLQDVYVSAGLGRKITPRLLVFLTNRLLFGKQSSTGQNQYEYRLWQEADYDLIDNNRYYLASRSMLEERKRFGQTPIALRFRQRLMLRMPLPSWPRHSFVVSEEAFLNLNSPDWVTNKFYSQNRVFIGIGTIVSKKVNFDFGYLNQYIMGNGGPNQMNNIIYFNVNITGRDRYYKG
jgi:hypothetical protein